ILSQFSIRCTNIVSVSQTVVSLNQPEVLLPRPRLNTGRASYATPDEKVYYICWSCNQLSGFKTNDMLRCLSCGGMIMFKPRVKQSATIKSRISVRKLNHLCRLLQYSAD
ncbi:hypothetical protein C7999DRAFT_13845, partial [Corynascus novoguineensis]